MRTILGDRQREYIFEEHEVKSLINLLDAADVIVGHNIKSFDFRVLAPYCDFDPLERFSPKSIDTLDLLYRQTGRFISLDHLAELNLGLRKTHNSVEIPSMWRAGRKNEVIEYLRNDLHMTHRIFYQGLHGPLKIQLNGSVRLVEPAWMERADEVRKAA